MTFSLFIYGQKAQEHCLACSVLPRQALPRLCPAHCDRVPEAIDPAGPNRAVQFKCDALYMAFISTQGHWSADFYSVFIHAADLHWRSCTEGADWSPACVHVTGAISMADARILVTKWWLQQMGLMLCRLKITENPLVIMKFAITPR